VFHVYPEGGVGSICQKLAEDLGGLVELEAPVQQILVEDGRAVAVRTPAGDVPVRAVVSTAPVNKLADLVSGTDRLERFRSFSFRPVVFVNLKLEGRNLLPASLTWIPKGEPFFRLTEAPISMPWLAPEGKTMVLAEYGARVGDGIWTASETDLVEQTLARLDRYVPRVRQRFIGARVQRTPIAYPMFLREYEHTRRELEQGTGVRGLLSIGRNGEFDHILMEDIYWRTLRRIRDLITDERLIGSGRGVNRSPGAAGHAA
jgi:protoporphyrinogen oxidase